MTVETTSTLSNVTRSRYTEDFEERVMRNVVYDMLATPWATSKAKLQRLTDANFVFLSEMEPATSALSQVADVTPEVLEDATASVTPTSRYGAIQASLQLMLTNYPGYGSERVKIVANNAAEGIDLLAQAAALQGGVVSRPAARAALDAGTAGNRLDEAEIAKAEMLLSAMKTPRFGNIKDGNGGAWSAIMADESYYDLISSSNVIEVSQYQKGSIILNRELGSIGRFKIIVPDWPKVFGAAGADNGTAIDTTLDGATLKLAKTLEVASGTSIAVGMRITIGTEETANTFYPTNERVFVTSVSGTTIGVAGSASNGGMRVAHASGAAFRNADSVYPVAYGGPNSLVKMFAPDVGEFGDIIMNKQGLLDQFESIGWLFFGQYGLIADNRIVRGEYSSAADA